MHSTDLHVLSNKRKEKPFDASWIIIKFMRTAIKERIMSQSLMSQSSSNLPGKLSRLPFMEIWWGYGVKLSFRWVRNLSVRNIWFKWDHGPFSFDSHHLVVSWLSSVDLEKDAEALVYILRVNLILLTAYKHYLEHCEVHVSCRGSSNEYLPCVRLMYLREVSK